MIRGTVNGRRAARVRLRLRGPDGTVIELTATVDTGFTGTLTVPEWVAVALGLDSPSEIELTQADGSAAKYAAYTAEVDWDGVWVPVVVSAIGREPLLGMRLLLGHELRMTVVPGGAVEVSPLA